MSRHACRFCGAPLVHTFVDLGMSPLANSYLEAAALDQGETFYPLHTYVCDRCFLVQLPEWQTPDAIFTDYAYFSSYSDSWLEHARRYTERMVERFGYDAGSLVVEVASNDGYLLKNFVARGVPVLGIEPAKNVAEAAEAVGVPTEVAFFGTELAQRLVAEGRRADLLLGNNVLAHTPYLRDFVAGLAVLLAPDGVVTLEFPHLVRLVESNQFDTIYHEHFSYFSFRTVKAVLEHHGLAVFDVEELPTHGGSLRVYARHAADASKPEAPSVAALVAREEGLGFHTLEPYRSFGDRVRRTKRRLLQTLIELKDAGKSIAGYGAPAKGVTFLNYCGVRSDLVDFTVDRSPHKQGKFLPGVHIPIHPPEHVREAKPDVLWILPWNLRHEIAEQMAYVRDWGGEFLVAVPEVERF